MYYISFLFLRESVLRLRRIKGSNSIIMKLHTERSGNYTWVCVRTRTYGGKGVRTCVCICISQQNIVLISVCISRLIY